jgi:hypothetical protein
MSKLSQISPSTPPGSPSTLPPPFPYQNAFFIPTHISNIHIPLPFPSYSPFLFPHPSKHRLYICTRFFDLPSTPSLSQTLFPSLSWPSALPSFPPVSSPSASPLPALSSLSSPSFLSPYLSKIEGPSLN